MTEMILGDALEVLIDHRGKTPRKLGADFVSSGVPVASALLVKKGRLHLESARFVDFETYRRWMPVPLKRHDVLLTSEAPLGECALMPSDDPLVLGQRLFGLRGKEGILDSRYLFYAFQCEPVRSRLQARATGTTVLGIRQSELVKISVPAPDFEAQQRISSLLGALDDKIAVNEKISTVALELCSTHLKRATRNGTSWRSLHLRDAARWFSGGTPSTSTPAYWDGEIPWISASSLKSPWINRSDRNVTALGATSGTRIVPPGAVIFVVRGMSLKKEFRIGIAQRDVAFGQDCKALIAVDGVDDLLLFYSLWNRKNDILDMVDEAGHGTGRLATDRLERLEIRVPPPGALDEITDVMRPLSQRAARCQAENHTLAELRDVLLPKLISGELRVSEAQEAVAAVV